MAACLDYAEQGPRPEIRLTNAHDMLADDLSLATASIAALATVGDHAGLRAALDAEPDAVDQPCGPNGWPPLLYATFSRIDTDTPGWSMIETVRLLLDRGADATAGFLWRGLVPPFTALTGALGGGESQQPWHPDRLEMVRLLLDAGADPNDGQALYNNGIGGQNPDNPAHLELLVEYGLGTHGIGTDFTPTERALRLTRNNDVDGLDGLLTEQPHLIDELRREHRHLCNLVSADGEAMLTRLVDLGFDINDRSTTKTPLHHAAEAGSTDRAQLFMAHGADPNLLDTHIGATPWGWANHFGQPIPPTTSTR